MGGDAKDTPICTVGFEVMGILPGILSEEFIKDSDHIVQYPAAFLGL